MKKIVAFLLFIVAFCICKVYAEDIVFTGVINEVYVDEGYGISHRCVVLFLDEEVTVDAYDSKGAVKKIKAKDIQLFPLDVDYEMMDKRVNVSVDPDDIEVSDYISPIYLTDAKISLATTSLPAASVPDISIKINGDNIEFDQPPIIKDDRTFVPIRTITENLGATVTWEQESRIVTVSSDKGNIFLVVDDALAYINGVPTILDVKPFIENERTMVPIRVIAQTLGADVAWDGDNRCVIINMEEKDYSEYDLSDASKPLVYDLSYSYKNGKFNIPQINLNSAGSFNQKIVSTVKQNLEYAYDASYQYSVNNGIISIVFSVSNDLVDCYSFNFDIKSGMEMTTEDLCKLLGMSYNEFLNVVKQKRVMAFDIMFPVSRTEIRQEDGGVSKEFYYDQRDNAGSDKYLSYLQWFIGADKNIQVIVALPSLYGGDYDYVIDTGISLF